MKTIKENVINEIEIKNSRFITLLYKINDNTNISSLLKEAEELYPKATHYCYAYKTTTSQKSSDNGEPGGTAGIPMLNVLIKEDIVNVLAITVRYFGGIKLGAGGLVRAYTKSLTESLLKSEYEELVQGYIIEITIDYNETKQLDYLLKDINILNKEFNDKVIYTIELNKDNLNLIENYNYKILKEELIELI